MAFENLDIRVRTQGAGTAARDLRNIGIAAGALTGQLSLTQRVFQGFAVAAVARRLASFADGFTLLQSRARLYTDSQEEANKVSEELIGIANRTRVATDAVSLTFQRLAINQDRLGLTTERVTRLTELLSKAVVVGGSNAQEAGGALRQFSQALSGNFQAAAQELNSVLEQTPGLAAALADGLGTTTDQIKRLAKEGRLSSKLVIEAIESQASAIEARFGRVAPTIGQAFQVLENSLSVFIGRAFQTTNAGKAITETLINIGNALLNLSRDTKRFNAVLEAAGTVLGTLAIARVTNSLLGLAGAADRVIGSLVRLVAIPIFGFLVSVVRGAALATNSLLGLASAALSINFSGIAGPASAAFRFLNQAVSATLTVLLNFGLIARFAFTSLIGLVTRAAASIRSLSFASLISGLRALVVQLALATAGFVRMGAAAAAAIGRGLIGGLQSLVHLVRTGLVVGLDLARVALVSLAGVSLGVLTAAVGVFAALLFGVRNETVQIGGEAVKVRDVLVAAFQIASEALGRFVDRMLTAFGAGGQGQSVIRRFFNTFVGLFVALFRTGQLIVGRLGDLFRGLGSGIVEFVSAIPGALTKALQGDISGAAQELGAAFANGFKDGAAGLDQAIGDIFKAELAKDQLQSLVTLAEGSIDGLADRAKKVAEERRKREAKPLDDGLNGGANPPAEGAGELAGALNKEQKAVADLVGSFDIATKIALEFRDAQDQLRGAVSKNVISQKEASQIITELAQDRFRRLAAQTDEAASATIQYNDTVRELTALARAGAIGQDELAEAVARLRAELLKTRETVEGTGYLDRFFAGANDGIKRFQKSLGTTFTQISDLTNTLLEQGLSALDKFVETGKFDFKEFAVSAIAEIQKVITRLLILSTIENFKEGGIGGVFSGLFKNGSEQQGQPTASTQTGASGGTQSIIEAILGGGRPGDDPAGKPAGTPSDPLSVRIVTGTPALVEAQVPLLEKLEELDGRQAERGTTASAEQEGLFTKLYGFITNLPSQISGFFSSLFGGGSGSSNGGGFLSTIGGLFGGGSSGGSSSGSSASTYLSLASSIFGAFSGSGGGGSGGGFASLFGGAMESGGVIGPSDLGKAFLVGEKRPELFMPRSTGTVVPNLSAIGGGAPPEVNVKVVNVDDPAGTLDIMGTREGEEVIMGLVARNPGKLRQIVGLT